MVSNRVKFFFAGPVLELANPRLPGRPHGRLVELVPKDPGRVLEICAGTGYLSRLIAKAHPGAELVALDISPEMLAIGRRRTSNAPWGRVAFVECDARELPFADDNFDTVVAAFGLHELPTEVRVGAVREAARVLRPGGRLIAVDIDAPARPSRAFSAYMRWIEKPHALEVVGPGLSSMLENAGFEISQRSTEATKPVPFQLIDAVLPPA